MDKPFPEYQGEGSYVFVCCAQDDEAIVYADIRHLHDKGINLWYDQSIPGGRHWRAEVVAAVKGAYRLLFFMSDGSLASVHCGNELEFALDNQIDPPARVVQH